LNKKTTKYFFVFLLLVFELGLAQEQNPTVYLFGGVPDSSRFFDWDQRCPLNFKNSNFYMDYVESNRGVRMLPAMFPIVLYNGDADWSAPVKFEELIESPERLGRFSINFEYFKLTENEFTREYRLRIKNIVSTLFLAESHYDIDLLIEELLALFDNESDKEAVSLFLNWFKQLAEHGRIDRSDYKSLEKVYQ